MKISYGNSRFETKWKNSEITWEDFKKRVYESLTARYEKAKSRLDEVEAEIHDKHYRRKSIEHYLEILTERKEAVTEYDVFLWHGMVEFVTVYSKDDIRFTMKDGTEIRV